MDNWVGTYLNRGAGEGGAAAKYEVYKVDKIEDIVLAVVVDIHTGGMGRISVTAENYIDKESGVKY